MNDVPFHSLLAPLEKKEPVTAADIALPDCHRILGDTRYGFNLEKWILAWQQPVCQAPSCPPYWLMFSSPLENRKGNPTAGDSRPPSGRPRSHSLNSGDIRRLHQRAVRFHTSDSEDEEGYCEDNEASSTEESPPPVRRGERPRSAAPKDQLSRVKDMHFGQCVRGHRGSLPSLQDFRAPEPHRSPQASSPPAPRQKSSKKKQRSRGSGGPKFSQNTAAAPSPCRLQQQRPSSAGPAFKNCAKKTLGTGGSRGVFFDSAAELLSALSQEERELLGTITEKGYPLRTAILALQKTGYHCPEKILKYLVASERLCNLGYDEAQVEEALEMFQNCESKAAEFLRLLTQFTEMGFQQNAIKEVLLVHENHRERALEELMTRMA
ncbi:ubiquitin-associated protein 1-like [Gasterosteus aculeatus]